MIADGLNRQIDEQRWIPGERLPSIRDLTLLHKVAKNTIIQALHVLESRGVLESRPKSGFFVKLQSTRKETKHPQVGLLKPAQVNVPEIFQDIMARSAAFDILPSQYDGPSTQSLTLLHRHINAATRNQVNKKAMYYDEPRGNTLLRTQIKEWYRASGVILNTDDFCITSGCQNSLFLALMATCQPGDNVALESPGFYGVLQLCQHLQLNVIEIPASASDGLDMDMLEAALQEWNITACVVTPAFATPSGASMPTTNRARLLDLANRHDLAIIEDDIYGDLGFTQRPVALKALDTQSRIILCSSMSKTLSRDLRLGWIAGGRWHDQIVKLKLVTSLASNQAIQIGLANFMLKGDLKRHLEQKRQILKKQRDQLVLCVQRFLPESIRFNVPDGGLSLWIDVGLSVNTQILYHQLLSNKVVITPGALFSLTSRFNNYLRLSFSHPTVGAREHAIQILGKSLDSYIT